MSSLSILLHLSIEFKIEIPMHYVLSLRGPVKLKDYCSAPDFTGVECNTLTSIFLQDLLLQTLVA